MIFTAAALVAYIITAAFKNSILHAPGTTHIHVIDKMWRLLIGLGAVPAVVALYFRLTIPETPRFTMDIERNLDQAATDIQAVLAGRQSHVDEDVFIQRIDAPKATLADFKAHFGKWENFKILFGTSYSWFALDVRLFIALLLHVEADVYASDCVLRPWPQLRHYSTSNWLRNSAHIWNS